jgi:type II secretion system protein H
MRARWIDSSNSDPEAVGCLLSRRLVRSRAAFTLVELMVVIVIIGIMTAMIIPEMRGAYEDALLRSTSRKLVNVFDAAYSRAVSLSELQRVRIDPGTGRYVIEQSVADQGQGDSFAPVRDLPEGEGTLDSRITIRVRDSSADNPELLQETSGPASPDEASGPENADRINFYPDGTADAREVLLKDRQGFRMLLRINPVTARIRISNLGRGSADQGQVDRMAP